MKAPTRRLAAVVLAAAMPLPCFAAPALIADVAVSSEAVPSALAPIAIHFGTRLAAGPHERASIGVMAGIKEGKPLEVMMWGGGGAIAGSFAGPLGTIVGAGTGALCGLLYSIFVVPHNGP
jgi:hypothetical protein